MASATNTLPHAERADIHKSCKSIETLLNVLNEYCEAAGAVVSLQKKLAKALRETAGIKVTGEIPANAMNASANIFEALSDVDSKFAKIADKEYDSISAEVKKWFKKLAKEEKLHDEKMASANAKIKQAGQVYEKKSKKKTADVSEEHARYINLINTLGPEVSQEKYNHTLNVIQRHASTTYSVAACLARLADTEWQKSYECVRRFSPTVGPLGQWRAMCEGGWTGSLPTDLNDLDQANAAPTTRLEESAGLKPIQEEALNPIHQPNAAAVFTESREPSEQPALSLPGYSTGPPSASTSTHDLQREPQSVRNSPTVARNNQIQSNVASEARLAPASTNLEPPRAPFVDPNTGSVRSLSAFPTPPTHFPLPPLRQPQSQEQQFSHSQSVPSSSNLEFPSFAYSNQLAESPVSAHDDRSGNSDAGEYSSRTTHDVYLRHDALVADVPIISPPSPERRYRERPRMPDEQMNSDSLLASGPSVTEIRRPIPVRSQTSLPPEATTQINRDGPVLQDARYLPSSSMESKPSIPTSSIRGNIEGEEEFGVMNNLAEPSNVRTHHSPKYPRPVERTDTGASNGSGSIVAAMRNRYSINSGSTSPPPRDLPRIPLSVNSLATRYEPTDAPLSPRLRAGSPPVLRQQSLPLLDTAARQAQESYQARVNLSSSVTNRAQSPEVDRRRRRNDELVEAERRAKEQELREREKDLEMRARDLERDRAKLQEDHTFNRAPHGEDNDAGDRQFALRPRERRTSLRQQFQRPPSQLESHDVSERVKQAVGHRSQHSYNTGHLAPPTPRGVNTPTPDVQPTFGQNSRPPSPKERHQPPDSQHDARIRDKYQNNPSYNSSTTSTTTSHASNCGCESCSISKYQSSSSPNQQTYNPQSIELPDNKRSEKKTSGGWIRRLSMPVGNALGLDSKRHQSNNSVISTKGIYALGNGVGSSPVSERRGLFSMDGKRNASTTTLRLPGGSGKEPQEDGRMPGRGEALGPGRRSYEASGISNRSMTSLGLTGRR